MRAKLMAVVTLIGLWVYWLARSLTMTELNTDLGRDLSELSNLWSGRVVWLGPSLSAGFPTSPLYYYIFLPALLISGGDPYSLLIMNTVIALTALGLLVWLGVKKWRWGAVVGGFVIGLSPWWLTSATTVGNGFTYVLWLFMSLAGLWFEVPFWVSAAMIGTAIAFHPIALVALPVFGYEIWRRRRLGPDLTTLLIALALPWVPVIAFSIITKGYYLHNWIARANVPIGLSLNGDNFRSLSSLAGVGLIGGLIVWVTGLLTARGRARLWLIYASIPLGLTLVSSRLQMHYILGILCLISFCLLLVLMETKIGVAILLGVVIIMLSTVMTTKLAEASRPISKIQNIVNTLVLTGEVDRSRGLAVLSILGPDVKVPMADDYRFFLRMSGYKVLDARDYDQAEVFLLFVEVPGFDWQGWSNYDLDRFGSKKIVLQTEIDGVVVVGYGKK